MNIQKITAAIDSTHDRPSITTKETETIKKSSQAINVEGLAKYVMLPSGTFGILDERAGEYFPKDKSI